MIKVMGLCSLLFAFSYGATVATFGKNGKIVSNTVDSVFSLYKQQYEAADQQIPENQLSYLRNTVIQKLIREKLMELEIKRLKIKVSSSQIDSAMNLLKSDFPSEAAFQKAFEDVGLTKKKWKEQLSQELKVQKLLEKKIKPITDFPSTKELRAYYKKNRKEFPKNDSLRASQIVFKLPERASKSLIRKKKKELNELRKEILAAGKTEKVLQAFTQVAYQKSEGDEAQQGGDLGAFVKGDFLPIFDKQISKLGVGEVSKVFQSSLGLHIVLLTIKNDGKYKNYKLAIAQKIIENKALNNQKKLSSFLGSLANRYKLKILDKNYTPVSATPGIIPPF